MTDILRNAQAGIPGNGGQFAPTSNAPADDVALSTPYVGTVNLGVRVAAGRAARARIDAGKKPWGEHIRTSAIWKQDDVPYAARRDQFVAAVQRSKWFTGQDEYSELHDLIDELKDLDDENDMKSVLEEVYNLADVDRIQLS